MSNKIINDQLVDVNCSRGSPMGRWEHSEIVGVPKSVYCFEVKLNNVGYDKGGAYWGIGKRLFCLVQPEYEVDGGVFKGRVYYRQFIRARDREAAIDKSGLALYMIKRSPLFVADKRFTCALEYYGAESRGFVLRFCNDWVDVFNTFEEARKAAIKDPRNWVNK